LSKILSGAIDYIVSNINLYFNNVQFRKAILLMKTVGSVSQN